MQDMQKSLIGAVASAMNAHDPAKVGASYADDATVTMAGVPNITGKEAIQADLKKLIDGFPNMKFGFSRVWAKNDVLVSEWVVNATHTGDVMGMKPTEKPIGYAGVSVAWVNADGKIKEEHRYDDFAQVLAQIGAGPKGMKARAISAVPTAVEWHWAKGTPEEGKQADGMKVAIAAFQAKDDKAFAESIAEDVTWDDNMAPVALKGRAEAMKMFKAFTTAFPDVKVQVTNAWGIDDFAIAEVTVTGTQKAAFMSVPATKKPVTLHWVDIVQSKDTKGAHGWGYGNSMEMMAQLGLMKPPGGDKPATGDKKPDAKPVVKKP